MTTTSLRNTPLQDYANEVFIEAGLCLGILTVQENFFLNMSITTGSEVLAVLALPNPDIADSWLRDAEAVRRLAEHAASTVRWPRLPHAAPAAQGDSWANLSTYGCHTCRFFVPKDDKHGRCRRHAPTMDGYPVVYPADWCGDHKLGTNPSRSNA